MTNKLNIIFAALYLLTNVLSAGQVICSGADGHNSIEKTHITNHCSTSHNDDQRHDHKNHDHENHTHEESAKTIDDCKPCTDVPLQGDAKLSDQNQKTVVYGVFESCTKRSINISFNSRMEIPFPTKQTKANQTLAFLRTIVLII